MRALAQHRFGKVEAMAHGGLHCTAMRLVEVMDDLSHWTPLQLSRSGFDIDVALLHDDLPEGLIGARFLPHARAPLNRLFLTAWKSFSILKPSPSARTHTHELSPAALE